MSNFKKAWSLLPRRIRQTIVLVIGFTLILSGVLLIVLPGPFTMPLLVLGLIVLALEFAWAESLLVQVRHHGGKLHPKRLYRAAFTRKEK